MGIRIILIDRGTGGAWGGWPTHFLKKIRALALRLSVWLGPPSSNYVPPSMKFILIISLYPTTDTCIFTTKWTTQGLSETPAVRYTVDSCGTAIVLVE